MNAKTKPATTSEPVKHDLASHYRPIAIAAVVAATLMAAPAAAVEALAPTIDAASIVIIQGQLDPEALTGLNPQPEPPSQRLMIFDPQDLMGLNPQPEPPSRRMLRIDPEALVGLNPQPEPPSASVKTLDPQDMIGLHLQPEPPSTRLMQLLQAMGRR